MVYLQHASPLLARFFQGYRWAAALSRHYASVLPWGSVCWGAEDSLGATCILHLPALLAAAHGIVLVYDASDPAEESFHNVRYWSENSECGLDLVSSAGSTSLHSGPQSPSMLIPHAPSSSLEIRSTSKATGCVEHRSNAVSPLPRLRIPASRSADRHGKRGCHCI